ncbi:MAG: hypothetical protein K8R54_02120 [Bacteroidales bacterium]|nr:hypothetical protein [Bacteroidales bacterium]
METMTTLSDFHIKVTEETEEAKAFIKYLMTLSFIEVVKEPNEETKKAIEDAKKGKTTAVNDIKSFFNEIKEDAGI